ncbi:MAG: formylglycine-generating enzyme family protein [Phycisphaerales bacterium]
MTTGKPLRITIHCNVKLNVDIRHCGIVACCIALLCVGCKARVHAVPTKSFTNAVGMQMVAISDGTFVCKYEVSQGIYKAVMGINPSWFQGDDLPVEMVSQADAAAFCEKLTALDRTAGLLPVGFVYALPSHEEWNRFATDATLDDANTPLNPRGQTYPEHTAPIDTGDVNSLGLRNICGNVSEWSRDRNDGIPYHLGPSWNTHQEDTAHARYAANYPSVSDVASTTGFRCVLIPEGVGKGGGGERHQLKRR